MLAGVGCTTQLVKARSCRRHREDRDVSWVEFGIVEAAIMMSD